MSHNNPQQDDDPDLGRWVHRNVDSDTQRERIRILLRTLAGTYGGRIHGYPAWHPFLCKQDPCRSGTTPQGVDQLGFIDHPVWFANAFVASFWGEHLGDALISQVETLSHREVTFHAQRLDEWIYAEGADTVLVYCKWHGHRGDELVPARVAIPLMLEHELPARHQSSRTEPWETMKPYILGRPSGHFCSEYTAEILEKTYRCLVAATVWGPVKKGQNDG
jgi:hypothetical protein